jgi:hypothetical protein
MTQKPESRTVTALLRILNSLPWTVADKNHGDAFERRGRADIVGCVLGFSFIIEVKEPGNKSTAMQTHEQARWASACAIVVTDAYSVRDAIRQLEYGMRVTLDDYSPSVIMQTQIDEWRKQLMERLG